LKNLIVDINSRLKFVISIFDHLDGIYNIL
jgi:hypothetical protein